MEEIKEKKEQLQRFQEERARDLEAREARSFAKGMNFYKLFWIFFIGCFVGVVIEMLWCLVTNGFIESRKGLIYGPFNLVYGFGALAMTVCLHRLEKKRDIWVFLGGFLIGSVYEYGCSWIQEAVFGTVSWQYDDFPFNLDGRINLLYSIFWGILALVWLKFLYPWMCRLIYKIPNRVGKPLTWVLLVFMILNTLVSGAAVARMTARQEGMPAGNVVEEFLDRHYPNDLLEKIYPNMVYVRENE